MLSKDQIIALVRNKGPVLPAQLNKDLNTTPIFVSAILSDLVDKGNLRLSYSKIGGSPLYYLEGQESKLPNLLYPHLHEKERKTYDILKQKGIMRDYEEETLIRVTLRNLRDFAIPLEVRSGENSEIFWKYFLLDDSEAEKKIRTILSSESPAKQEQKKTSKKNQKGKNWSPKQKQRTKNKKKTNSSKKNQKNIKKQKNHPQKIKKAIKKQSKNSSKKALRRKAAKNQNKKKKK